MRTLTLLATLLLASPAAAVDEDVVSLLLEGVVVGASPTNMLKQDCSSPACDFPLRYGFGALIGNAMYLHVRNERWAKRPLDIAPRILEVRVGVGGTNDETSAITGMKGHTFAYLAYREVRDMRSREGGVISTGRGFQVGGMFNVNKGPARVFGDIAWVQYVDAWPIHDRSRGGFLARAGGTWDDAPFFFAARFDGDPGAGFTVGAELGLLAFVKLHPDAWKKH